MVDKALAKSEPREPNGLEGESLGELVEVGVVMEHRDAAVLGGGRSDQRVGDRHAVVSVATLGQLTERPIATSATARSLRRIRSTSSSLSMATYSVELRAE
jgi:hypothetical protein